MTHITIKDLADGITTEERDQLTRTLVRTGKNAAIRLGCKLVSQRTGLPKNVCEPAVKSVVQKISKSVRDKLSDK